MSQPIQLDVNNPAQVSSASLIQVDLTKPDQQMFILGGIACPEWEVTDDGHLYGQTIVVNLRKTVLAVEQATISVGLASIGNKNTTFQFACDSTSLTTDPVTQEILLTVNASLRGDWSILNRFGYQIVAIVTTQITGISGTIRWNKDLFDPAPIPAGEIGSLFVISANTQSTIPGGPFGSTTIFTQVASGALTDFTNDDNDYIFSYNIPGAPYNQNLVIHVDPTSLFSTRYAAYSAQTSGPNPVMLSINKPGVSEVDFRINLNVVK